MWELKQRYNGYRFEQYNLIIDVLGGYSKHLKKSLRKLLGARARSVLERMQKSVISNTFEHCQNISDKYLVRALRTPVFPETQIRLLVFLLRFF